MCFEHLYQRPLVHHLSSSWPPSGLSSAAVASCRWVWTTAALWASCTLFHGLPDATVRDKYVQIWKPKSRIMNPCGFNFDQGSGNSRVILSFRQKFLDSCHKFSQKFPQDQASSTGSSKQLGNTTLYSLPPPFPVSFSNSCIPFPWNDLPLKHLHTNPCLRLCFAGYPS